MWGLALCKANGEVPQENHSWRVGVLHWSLCHLEMVELPVLGDGPSGS